MLFPDICVAIILHIHYAYGTTTSTSLVSKSESLTCPSRTVNYITHTLPKQCLASTRSTGLQTSGSSADSAGLSTGASVHSTAQAHNTSVSTNAISSPSTDSSLSASASSTASFVTSIQSVTTIIATSGSPPVLVPLLPGPADEDSPLESGNFLSFEDWKKQNLIKAGQSEHLGRNARVEQRIPRKRHENVHNTLDSLGDDAEIEIDFSALVPGSVDTSNIPVVSQDGQQIDNQRLVDTESMLQPRHKSKDAGTTHKERFNYASFDCAANVLKSNSEAKNANLVLRENKDLYMLNKCSASNKFIILELCDDILIDTVALANFEFFSSSFHTFRVSVSDRYPVKIDKWKSLGVFEARNTREVQAFLVPNPVIWARYMRIEFLTHYGTEFYCPVSLIRVHGTTMLEEYKHDLDTTMDEDEDEDEDEEELEGTTESEVSEDKLVPEAVDENLLTGQYRYATSKEQVPPNSSRASQSVEPVSANGFHMRQDPTQHVATSPNEAVTVQQLLMSGYGQVSCCDGHLRVCPHFVQEEVPTNVDKSPALPTTSPSTNLSDLPQPSTAVDVRSPTQSHASQGQPIGDGSSVRREPVNLSTPKSSSETKKSVSTRVDHPRTDSTTKEPTRSHTAKQSGSGTQSQPASPTMQESFFKSVQKRLQTLESNSSLSLQYIEDQSRALRDAFRKVEQRQLSKTGNFLEHLNQTVLNELREFRQQYDQLWQSTVIELELQREKYQQESQAMHARLGVLADELIFQRRVSILQMVLILICLGLILFSRGAVNDYLELPLLQNVLSRSPSSKWIALSSDSRASSPVIPRTRSSHQLNAKPGILKTHTRGLSEDLNHDQLNASGLYSPPTPVSFDGYSEAELVKVESRIEEPEFSPDDIQRPSTSPPVLPSVEGSGTPRSISSLDDTTIDTRVLTPDSPSERSRPASTRIERLSSPERHLTWNLPD